MEYLIKVSALIVLLYLGYTAFLKKETFFNHNRWFLIVGLVTALILPLIVIPIYISVEPISIAKIPTDYIIDNSTDIVRETPLDWSQLLPLIYTIGVIICLSQFVLQFGSLLILLLKNAKRKDGIYTYVIVKNRISPFSFFKWIVYNPNLFSKEELQLIINHEKVHVRQWHSVDIVVSRLVCVFFWFNPLMWFYHKDIQQNLEYIADENAQNSSDSKKNYQHLLLKTSVGNNNSNLTSNFYNSLIKKRIVMLQKNRSKSFNRWKSLFILPLFAIFLMSFNTEEVFIEVEKPLVENAIRDISPDFENLKLIEIIFSKDTSDEEIKRLKAELKAQDIDMIIKNIKRDKKGEIIKINISFESKDGSTNYSVSDNNAIAPFYFKLDDNNNMSVGAFKNEIIEVEEQEIIEVIEEPQVIEEIIEVIEEGERKGEEKSKTKTFVIRQNGNITKISGDTISIIERNPNVKASYSYFSKDTIMVGKPVIKANGNVKVSSNKFVIRTNGKNKTNNGDTPLIIVDGVPVTKNQLKELNPDDIKKLNVLKSKKQTKIYGKAGEDGVIEIITKKNTGKEEKNTWEISSAEVSKLEFIPNSTKEDAEIFIKSAKKPLIIVNGETLGNINIKGLDPNVIGEITVIKGDKAIEMYGDKAKNGALIIFTKDEVENQKSLRNNNYTAEVSSIGYVDDENPEEKMVLYFISKITPKSLIDKHVSQLKSIGVTAKISKLKRNSDGDITRIKIALKDKEGNNSSATFENKNGIPTINFGKQGGNLVVSSKKL